jgi:hypothetical protein
MDPKDLLQEVKITGDAGAYTIRLSPTLILLLLLFSTVGVFANWALNEQTTKRLDEQTLVMTQTRDSIRNIESRQLSMSRDVDDVKENQEKLGKKLKSLSGQVHKEHGEPPDWDDSAVRTSTDKQGG